MRAWTNASNLGRLSFCMFMCEDLATILRAWCLYLAGSLSFAVSLPLFLSLSPYVGASADLGLRTEQKFCILVVVCSLCLFTPFCK